MASTKLSADCDSSTSCARVPTTSSGSLARTVRISARSAGLRCAPPEQTASLRSRGARSCRKSSITSGLSVSTLCLPYVFETKHNCTGGAGHAEWTHDLMVQFQQHRRGVCCAHFEVVIRREMAVHARRKLALKQQFVVRENTHPRGGRSGNRKVQCRVARKRAHRSRSHLRGRC